MHYRIEMSKTRQGSARLHLPGRIFELEATRAGGARWDVLVRDTETPSSGNVDIRAANASDAVWRVARAAVRAVAELTGTSMEGGIGEPDAPRPTELRADWFDRMQSELRDEKRPPGEETR